ncbi:MAG: hypothetical protein V9E83_03325 [Baekduia sp.]
MARPRLAGALLTIVALASALAVLVVTIVVWTTPHPADERAVAGKGAGLVLIWCVGGGLIQIAIALHPAGLTDLS